MSILMIKKSNEVISLCEKYADYQLLTDIVCEPKRKGLYSSCDELFSLKIWQSKSQLNETLFYKSVDEMYPNLFLGYDVEIIKKETSAGKKSSLEKEIELNKINGPLNIDLSSDSVFKEYETYIFCFTNSRASRTEYTDTLLKYIFEGRSGLALFVEDYGCRFESSRIKNSKILENLRYYGSLRGTDYYTLAFDDDNSMSVIVTALNVKSVNINSKSFETTESPLLDEVFAKKWSIMPNNNDCEKGSHKIFRYDSALGEDRYIAGKKQEDNNLYTRSVFQQTGPNTFIHTQAMYAGENGVVFEITKNPNFRIFKWVTYYEYIAPDKLAINQQIYQVDAPYLFDTKKLKIQEKNYKAIYMQCK